MKTLRLSFLAFAALAFSLSSSAQMVAANDRVRLEVRLDGDREEKDLKRTTTDKVTQRNTLQISLSGKARAKEDRVIQWTAYGRNLKSNNVLVVKTGKSPLALDASGKQSFASTEFSTTYTPDHGVVTRNPNRRGGGRAREVDGTGTKFVGYHVTVLDGDKVVGEAGETPANVKAK